MRLDRNSQDARRDPPTKLVYFTPAEWPEADSISAAHTMWTKARESWRSEHDWPGDGLGFARSMRLGRQTAVALENGRQPPTGYAVPRTHAEADEEAR